MIHQPYPVLLIVVWSWTFQTASPQSTPSTPAGTPSSSQPVSLLPTGYCLLNCLYCSNASSTACPAILTTQGLQYCSPFFTGPQCSLPYPALSPFLSEANTNGWAVSAATCNDSSGNSVPAWAANQNTNRTLIFPSSLAPSKVVVRLTLAVPSALTQPLPRLNPTPIDANTFQAWTAAFQPSAFLTVQANLNNVITNPSVYRLLLDYQSPTVLSCGSVYQFELEIVSSSPISTLQLFLASQTTFFILSTDILVGCSGFTTTLSSALNSSSPTFSLTSTTATAQSNPVCQDCLGGTYPLAGLGLGNPTLAACIPCDSTCQTCTAQGCLVCELWASRDSQQRCFYLASTFSAVTQFTLTTGQPVALTPQSLVSALSALTNASQLVNSLTPNAPSSSASALQGAVLAPPFAQSSLIFASAQNTVVLVANTAGAIGYYFKCLIFFPSTNTFFNTTLTGSSSTSTSPVSTVSTPASPAGNVILTGTKYSTQTLRATNLSPGDSPSIQVTVVSDGSFFLANPFVLLRKCFANCLLCTAGGSACSKCLPFFDISAQCTSCVTGFALVAGQPNRCVKCHSSCFTCQSPSDSKCLTCFNNFEIKDVDSCTQCLLTVGFAKASQCSSFCSADDLARLTALPSTCSTCNTSTDCLLCLREVGLGAGECVPSPTANYILYSSDLNHQLPSTQWQGYPLNITNSFNCTADYVNLVGVPTPSRLLNFNGTFTISFVLSSLPAHSGLTVFASALKVDSFSQPLTTLSLTAASPPSGLSSVTTQSAPITLPSFGGSNICGGVANELLVSFALVWSGHSSTGPLTISLTSPEPNFFISQVQVYLGNCESCLASQLTYDLKYIPRYAAEAQGLDVWLTFSEPVFVPSSFNLTLSDVFSAVGFAIDNTPVNFSQANTPSQLLEPYSASYFLPLTQPYTNSTLTALLARGNFAQRVSTDGANLGLANNAVSTTLIRFEDPADEQLQSLSTSKTAFHWIGLLIAFSPCLAIFGLGALVEDLFLNTQLLALHYFVGLNAAPSTKSVPVQSLAEFLITGFALPGPDTLAALFSDPNPSPYFLQKLTFGTLGFKFLFELTLLNLVCLAFFLSLLLVRWCCCQDAQSHPLPAAVASIADRPVAYIEQVWRVEWVSVVWAATVQFGWLSSSTGLQSFLIFLVVGAFAFFLCWLCFVVVYTYCRHFALDPPNFFYFYGGVYPGRMSSLAAKLKYYAYNFWRALRYALYPLLVLACVEGRQAPLIALFFLNIFDCVLVAYQRIFQSQALFLFKLLENSCLSLLIVLDLAILIVRDDSDFSVESYQQLGSAWMGAGVFLIILGLIKTIYLVGSKLMDWRETHRAHEHSALNQLPEERELQERVDDRTSFDEASPPSI